MKPGAFYRPAEGLLPRANPAASPAEVISRQKSRFTVDFWLIVAFWQRQTPIKRAIALPPPILTIAALTKMAANCSDGQSYFRFEERNVRFGSLADRAA
jgi:hypothetical protein